MEVSLDTSQYRPDELSVSSHNSLVNANRQLIGSILRSIKTDFHFAIIFLHPDNFTVLGLKDIQAFAHVWVQSRQHPPAWKHPTILPSGFGILSHQTPVFISRLLPLCL